MKKLVLEVLTTKWGKLLRVKEQTHRGGDFGNNLDFFMSSSGFRIESHSSPEIQYEAFYIRGHSRGKDNTILVVPSDEWLDKCRVAVREYNENFSDKPIEPKPTDDVEVIE